MMLGAGHSGGGGFGFGGIGLEASRTDGELCVFELLEVCIAEGLGLFLLSNPCRHASPFPIRSSFMPMLSALYILKKGILA